MSAIKDGIDKQRNELQRGRKSVAPLWIPDTHFSECQLCSASFSILFRRHHCRNCGKVVCENCSSNRVLLPHVHETKPLRVCDECVEDLQNGSLTSSRPPSGKVSVGAEDSDSEDEEEEVERERCNVSEDILYEFNEFLDGKEDIEEPRKIRPQKVKKRSSIKEMIETMKSKMPTPMVKASPTKNIGRNPSEERQISPLRGVLSNTFSRGISMRILNSDLQKETEKEKVKEKTDTKVKFLDNPITSEIESEKLNYGSGNSPVGSPVPPSKPPKRKNIVLKPATEEALNELRQSFSY